MTAACDESPLDGPRPLPAGWRRALTLLWLGQIVSHVGDAFFLGVVFFLALDVTGSRSAAGLLMALNFTPALALGLFAGALVDRHDRRRVMIAADLLRGFAVATIPVLALVGRLGPVGLGAAIFALAIGTTLFNPAIKALIPELTPDRHLTTAASLFQVADYGALVVGPLIAALALPRLGAVPMLWWDAATFFFSAACLAMLPRAARQLSRTPSRSTPRPGMLQLGREVVTGVRAVLAEPVLRLVLALATLDNVLTMGLLHVATPLFVREALGLGPEAYFRAQTFFFLGMAFASATFWLLGRRAPKGITIVCGLVLDGLTLVPIAWCQTLWQLELALFLHACAIPLIIIPRTVLIQQRVPGPLHGRTFALLNVSVFGMMAVSSGLTGVLADHVPVRTLFVAMGLVGVLPGLLGLSSGVLRRQR